MVAHVHPPMYVQSKKLRKKKHGPGNQSKLDSKKINHVVTSNTPEMGEDKIFGVED